jgi:chromosome segregation ATPase
MEGYGQMISSEFEQLTAELAEVRERRDRLHAANNRVAIRCGELREECDNLRVAVVDSNGQAASLREQVQEMRAQRDAMERTADAMRVSRDEERKAAADLREELERVKENCGMANRMIEALQGDVIRLRANCDDRITESLREELAQAREAADTWHREVEQLQGKVYELRLRQIPESLPGLLEALRGVADQAAELI